MTLEQTIAYSSLVLSAITTTIALFKLYLEYLDRQDKKKEQGSKPAVILTPTLAQVAKYGRNYHVRFDENGMVVQTGGLMWTDALANAIVQAFAPIFPNMPITTFWWLFLTLSVSVMVYSVTVLQRAQSAFSQY